VLISCSKSCRAGIPGYRQDDVRAGSREGDARGLDQGGGAGAQRFRREVRGACICAFVDCPAAPMPGWLAVVRARQSHLADFSLPEICRGIDVVRNKIKMFAQQKVTLPAGKHKVVILDEADSMTSAAQQAMRRTMELYSATTRFALACNNSSEIIEPIQSRCAILRFTKPSDAEVYTRLEEICQKEDVRYTTDGLESIIFTADGDLRQAVNSLQSTASGFDIVDQSTVLKVCDQPHPKVAEEIVQHCHAGELHKAHRLLEGLWEKGYSAQDIVQVYLSSLIPILCPKPSFPALHPSFAPPRPLPLFLLLLSSPLLFSPCFFAKNIEQSRNS
jgi:hypothetical protein